VRLSSLLDQTTTLTDRHAKTQFGAICRGWTGQSRHALSGCLRRAVAAQLGAKDGQPGTDRRRRKIGLPDGRVAEWESGKRRPTVAELRKAASVYKRSLGVFYLDEPPKDFDTLRDFRRLEPGESGEWSAPLHAEYRRAHAQREALLDLLELDGAPAVTTWRLARLGTSDASIAEAARANLAGLAPLQFPQGIRDQYAHLNYWTSALEVAGVLVMSTERGQVTGREMRAFSLYYDEVPVIVLNGADSPRGRTFSLLHECVHLVLHTTGLCDTTTDNRATSANRQVEARCNAIAAEVLMPAAVVLRQPIVAQHHSGDPWTLDDLIVAARPFGASVESFLRRLVALGLASEESYRRFRERNAEGDLRGRVSGKGNFCNSKVRDLGKGYVRQVTDAYRRTLIDTTTAATFLDAKVSQISELAQRAHLRNSRGA
jgi:Zn-dependent peptidase ImmA (M78 family)